MRAALTSVLAPRRIRSLARELVALVSALVLGFAKLDRISAIL